MLHTLRCKRAIWRVWSTPWRQRAIGKVWGIWVIAHANVWISHGLVPAARHANLGLAHREMLSGLGWRDRVLDMLEVVGLDRPPCRCHRAHGRPNGSLSAWASTRV